MVQQRLMAADIPTLLTLQDLEDESATQHVIADNLTQMRLSRANLHQKGAGLSPFKPKSSFCPLMPKDAVDIFHERVTDDIKKLYFQVKHK